MYKTHEIGYDKTMKTWFTSDLHLGHARINELAGRPFSSTEECDQEIIRRWNERVADEDTVYVLGDVCMGDLQTSLELAAELKGLKILVPGNHDRVSSLYKGSAQKKGEWDVAYREAGFRVMPEQYDTMIGTNPVKLCHFPYEGDSHGEDRYRKARPIDLGRWLIHGHVHEQWKIRGRQINVGVDVWDFAPVSSADLNRIISNR